jgi:3-oxoacyl-[acyl-carrier protein] reductase
MDFLLKDKSVIVTGGTAGIGKACALAFASHGAKVCLFGRNQQRGEEVVSSIKDKSGEALFIQVDVSNTKQVEAAVSQVVEEFGGVDIVVNNAGITKDGLLMRMSEQDWDSVMTVNVKSCYNVSKVASRLMMRSKYGKIINMSSIVGLAGNPGQTNYAASKAAVIGFTKALARELASRNICVNCIAPGFIKTTMTDAMTEKQKDAILSSIPLGRIGEPEDIANMALFLASPLSDYVTGQVFTVDGGKVM